MDDTIPDERAVSVKAVATEMWEDAIDDLPDDEEWAESLREADIHDRADRIEIEEIIDHDVPQEQYGALEDAFHDLKMAFEDWWA